LPLKLSGADILAIPVYTMNTTQRFNPAAVIGSLVSGKWIFPRLAAGERIWQISVGLVRGSAATEVPITDIMQPIPDTVAAYHQVEHGMHKMQQSARFMHTAKNIGRANYTSPLIVALTKASSLYNKQLSKGYSIGGIEGRMYLPMKIHKFDKHAAKISYPAEVTAKCDGLDVMFARACAEITISGMANRVAGVVPCGGVFAYSPTKKFYYGPRVDAIGGELRPFFDKFPAAVVNGELYRHGRTLEDINSDIRASTNQQFFQLYVFDAYFPDVPDMTYTRRLAILHDCIAESPLVQFVPHCRADTKAAALDAAQNFVAQGYEGGVISNLAGTYRAYIDKVVRSYDKQKIVAFDSDEFRIAGFMSDGRGKHAGIIKWVVETPAGKEFRVNYADCPEAFQREMLVRVQAAPAEYIGKLLTVRYRGLTKYGIPKFAKAIAIRAE
jgi:hypothetical protein